MLTSCMLSRVSRTLCKSNVHIINFVDNWWSSGNRVAAALEAVPEESTIPYLSYTVRVQRSISLLKLNRFDTDSVISKINRGDYLVLIYFHVLQDSNACG